jgi:hypothetical protein
MGDDSRRLRSSSSLANCGNSPMAYFHSSCRTALSHITGLHYTHCHVCPHPPRWPTTRTHQWVPFVHVVKLRCYASLAYIHTHCRDCPHPPGWPTTRTHHRPNFVRAAEPCCYTTLAYIHMRCRDCLILLVCLLLEHIASLHSSVLPPLPSSSSLAYCPNAPPTHFRTRCRTSLLHIANVHLYPLPCLPSSSWLAYRWNAPLT